MPLPLNRTAPHAGAQSASDFPATGASGAHDTAAAATAPAEAADPGTPAQRGVCRGQHVHITFGLDLDACQGPSPEDHLARPVVGRLGMLSLLETWLGLAAPEVGHARRVAVYLGALRQVDGPQRFYHRSLAADDVGTAAHLLDWRDTWALAGWAGQAMGRSSQDWHLQWQIPLSGRPLPARPTPLPPAAHFFSLAAGGDGRRGGGGTAGCQVSGRGTR